MSKPDVFLRQATENDVAAIVDLLNLTYRNDVGWTNEASLVGGIRTTATEIQSIVNDPDNYFFVYPQVNSDSHKGTEKEETGRLLATISVTFKRADNSAYIGLFAVHPSLQGQGVGGTILGAAETFAERHLSSHQHSNENNQAIQAIQLKQENVDSSSCNKVRLTMSILSQRPELLSYYQRRGYQLNGENQPFPNDDKNGVPKFENLELLGLEKWV